MSSNSTSVLCVVTPSIGTWMKQFQCLSLLCLAPSLPSWMVSEYCMCIKTNDRKKHLSIAFFVQYSGKSQPRQVQHLIKKNIKEPQKLTKPFLYLVGAFQLAIITRCWVVTFFEKGDSFPTGIHGAHLEICEAFGMWPTMINIFSQWGFSTYPQPFQQFLNASASSISSVNACSSGFHVEDGTHDKPTFGQRLN